MATGRRPFFFGLVLRFFTVVGVLCWFVSLLLRTLGFTLYALITATF